MSPEELEELYAPYPPPDWSDITEAELAVIAKHNEGLPPTKQLPPAWHINHDALKYHWYRKPLVIYYGFGLGYQDWIKEHRLPTPPSASRPSSLLHLADRVRDRLRPRCNFYDLDLYIPLSVPYDTMLHLYDSHTFQQRELSEDEEQDVINILKQELPCLNDQEPRWFYSID
ncbi:hypothetical protein J3R30DRAFT_3702442 [Lentinula aciculospora]|uniref:Uncharacterized protein n=1 Tax=Lentinula aciculospora TaxID=153920 RepID=A0A9W9DPD0_9AGAR|nr:hypothetical protein J3R30DRAFT_3702442 [Lentinula aciculospora]